MNSGQYPPPYDQQPFQPGQFQPPNQLGQYQPPSYPQPPKRRNLWQWYKSKGRFAKLGIGCGSLLFLLMLCTCSLAAYGSTLPKQKAVQPAPTTNNNIGGIVTTASTPLPASPTATPTEAPTPTPKPTATPIPKPAIIPSSAAVLGSTITAFDNKLGSNNCCYENGWDLNNMWVGVYTAQDGTSWYQAVGEQSNERVVGLNMHPYNSDAGSADTPVWNTIQDAEKVCDAYLPPDAKLKKSSGSSFEYSSAMLANTLPKSDFIDLNNHLEQPGLFFVDYDNYNSSPQIDCCLIGTDQGLQRENLVGR